MESFYIHKILLKLTAVLACIKICLHININRYIRFLYFVAAIKLDVPLNTQKYFSSQKGLNEFSI